MLAVIQLNMEVVALRLGSIEIRWYGIFVALGFLAGMVVLQLMAKRRGLRAEDGADLALPALLGGILGARVFYVLQFWRDFSDEPAQIFAIHKGGLVFYGGLIGATVAVVGFCKLRKISVAAAGDLFGLALPVGQAIGRLGCLFNSCCFGVPASGFWSVLYPIDRSEVYAIQLLKGVIPQFADRCHAVLPVQFHMTLTNLVIFGALLLLAKRLKTPGRLGALSLCLYAIGRFSNEFFRGDHVDYLGPFTISQTVSLVLLPIGIACWIWAGRQAAGQAADGANEAADGGETA